MPLPVIDSHQHFWKYDPVRDQWISDDMEVLKRNFLPAELEGVLSANGVDGCVAVQASETAEETRFLLDLAHDYPFIKAVVGWIDLEADDPEEILRQYKNESVLKGFRPMLQHDPQRDRMLQPAFMNGIKILQLYNYTCDLIILPDQLTYAARLAAAFPGMRFAIDHLAKPQLDQPLTDEWKKGMSRFRELENVYCKMSGLVTQADRASWSTDNFLPAIDHVVETFGTSRIMFGSDWPVCLLAAGYGSVKDIMENYFTDPDDKAMFFSANAIRFYSI